MKQRAVCFSIRSFLVKMEARTLQSPSSSISERGWRWRTLESSRKGRWTVTIGEQKAGEEESQPSVELGLGISPNCSARNPMSSISSRNQSRKTQLVFTRAQLSELYEQTLVFKFISAGLPLPLRLLPSICKGAYSLGTRGKALDFESMMDPEPNRCRRTDGKKWRCRKTVVPNQKYCESHMHRGRQRSRKPVELSKKRPPETASRVSVPGNSKGSSDNIPLGLPLMMLPEGNSNCSKRAMDGYGSGKRKGIPEANITSTVVVGTPAATYLNFNIRSGRDKDFVRSVEEKPKVVQRSSITGNISTKRDAIAMLGCSPRSVLPGSSGGLCSRMTEGSLEPWRCKRTDGKRWRCSRDVLPDQKYCTKHINRGVTKLTEIMAVHGSNPMNLNTSLSISVTSATLNEGKSCSSSDTTLTDSAVGVLEHCSDATS